MARDTKILQLLVDGQRLIRQDIKQLEKKVDDGFQKTTVRIDKLGVQLAELSDDAPTIEEFDNLEKRVTKLEHPQFASN
ncbi:MAG: hypothetical protein AAB954_02050 [Patescibacteria group bacterium]